MQLWFASRTGKVERIISKLQLLNTRRIIDGTEEAAEEFILLTYTDGFGEVPKVVEKFLSNNHHLLRGVAGSGNKNFGKNFCKSAYIIHERYNVPILMTFDLMGADEDILEFKSYLEKFNIS